MANPTIAVLTDNFGSGANARANTPTGSTTGPYGTPQSSWGVGNGWLDLVGSTSASGTGWNIAGGVASCAKLAAFAYLMQDPNLTQTPNQRIVATTTGITLSSNATYIALVRANPSTDGYALVLSSTAVYIAKLSNGNGSSTTLVTTAVTPTAGHVYSLDLTATGDGATTTTLTGVVKDVTAGTTLATVTIADTTLELQSGGRVGIAVYNNTGSGTLGFSQAVVYSDTALPFTRTALGFIGDSLTYSLSTTLAAGPDIFCRILNARSLTQQFVPVNMGFSGATAALYQNGNASGYMAAAIQNFKAMGVQTVFLMLGSNDAIAGTTPATWLANMQAIVNYVAAQIPGVKIIVNFPPYLDWVRFYNAFGGTVSAATLPLLKSYLPYLAQLTGVTIGDVNAINTFQNVDFYGLTDGGHGNDQGAPVLISLWLNASYPALLATKYPVGIPIGKLAVGNLTVNVPWEIPATGLPGSTGTPQLGNTSYNISAAAANELCNLLDRMIEDGRAALT